MCSGHMAMAQALLRVRLWCEEHCSGSLKTQSGFTPPWEGLTGRTRCRVLSSPDPTFFSLEPHSHASRWGLSPDKLHRGGK